MQIKELFNKTDHRPWKIPDEKWAFYQEWNDVVFLHWQVELSVLRKLVPKEIDIDLYEGNPWVSVVAFSMENIRPKNLPYFSPISNFHEINIRTYVKYRGKAGVYFLIMEAGKKVSSQVAKQISGLPYRYSKMKRHQGTFTSENSQFNDRFLLEYKTGAPLAKKEELDLWLTERYALFQDSGKAINAFDVHHVEWPILEVELIKLELNYDRFGELLMGKPKSVAWSKGVQVLTWNKKKNQL